MTLFGISFILSIISAWKKKTRHSLAFQALEGPDLTLLMLNFFIYSMGWLLVATI